MLIAMIAAVLTALAPGSDETTPHQVVGKIDFFYSFPETLARAQENGKPIFAYFTFET